MRDQNASENRGSGGGDSSDDRGGHGPSASKPPIHLQPIHLQVDKQNVVAPKTPMTGLEIRALHQPPIDASRDLYLKVSGPGDDRKIGDGESVDLKEGMHFFSVPSQINPGGAATGAPQGSDSALAMEDRYTGLLLDSDVRWLDEKSYKWTLTPDGGGGDLLVVSDYPLAPGRYDRAETDLLVQIPPSYNDATLDMWWVNPPVRLAATGAAPVAADASGEFLGRTWQRFSRHLNGTWRAGIDDLPRYMAIIAKELQQPGGL